MQWSFFDMVKAFAIYPILEELLYRRILLVGLRSRYSFKKSVIVLSLGFSIGHIFSDTGLLYVFLVSVLFSVLYLLTAKLWHVIFMHALLNLLSYYSNEILSNFFAFKQYAIAACFLFMSMLVSGAAIYFKRNSVVTQIH